MQRSTVSLDGPWSFYPNPGAAFSPESLEEQPARQVHAGLAVGWLHRPVALIVEQPVGRGRLLACSFQLSRSLTTNPVAATMLDDMLHHLRCQTSLEAGDGC